MLHVLSSRTYLLRAGALLVALPLTAAGAQTLSSRLPDAPSALLQAAASQTAAGSSSSVQSTPPTAVLATAPTTAPTTGPQQPAGTGTGVIFGDVIDSHDGLVPGAKVVATQLTASGGGSVSAPVQVMSDSAGHFELRGLTAGTWSVAVSADGLAKFLSPKEPIHSGERRELQGVVLGVPEQHADVTVTMTIEQVAEQEVHDEEKQRVVGIFPNYNMSYVWNAAPLNARQKYQLSLKATLDPISLFTALLITGEQQYRDTHPQFGEDAGGFGERYGRAYATTFIGHTIGYAVLPSAFRQDPRYFYMGTGSVKRRTIHAVMSSVLCRGNSGHTEFNFSHVLGNFAAGLISRTYYTDSSSITSLAVNNTLVGLAGEAGVNVFREFFLKRFSTGTPAFGNGKPAGENSSSQHP